MLVKRLLVTGILIFNALMLMNDGIERINFHNGVTACKYPTM